MSKKSGTFVSFAGVHPHEVAQAEGQLSVSDDIKKLASQIWGDNYAQSAEYLTLFENKSRDHGMIRIDLLERILYIKEQRHTLESPDNTHVDL